MTEDHMVGAHTPSDDAEGGGEKVSFTPAASVPSARATCPKGTSL